MRLEQDRLSQIKNYIYIASSALLFITWCLSLAALTQTGGVDGRIAWAFGLCFLTLPLILYQSLTPMWSRTARFSNPHAHCAVDGVLVVLWLSAWAALAAYVVSGKGKGTSTDKNATGCDNFAHGSASKCRISEADIIFSLLMMLCFVATGFFSFKVLMEFKRTGVSPNSAHLFGHGKSSKTDISYSQKSGYEDHEDEAFDARMNLGHEEQGGRDSGYSFEATRVHGGAPEEASYIGAPGGYESVPNAGGDEHGYGQLERPTSFAGPLRGNRI